MPTSGGSPERRHTMGKNTAPADIGSTIFETLKKELLDLTIKPGDLIAETETCERFAVTRPPVRAAFRRLCDIGLVEIRPYYGTHATLLDFDKVCQIIHLRTVLETKLIQDFIASCPDDYVMEELDHTIRLQNILLKQEPVSRTEFFSLDNALHSCWFRHLHCGQLWEFLQDQQYEYIRFRMLDYTSCMQYQEMIREHERLVEAIRTRDSAAIPRLIGQHLSEGVLRVRRLLPDDAQRYVIPPKDPDYWESYINEHYGSAAEQ